ncbi:MAG: class I SAM-dependent methyltransferase [Spirochaetota bacterium]|nr:class I SAM-dependent methyltransferase [Spirochaetota bacterium]
MSTPTTRGILIRWPSWYDVMNRFLFLGRERQFRERTIDLAAITRGHTVLDVGCGTGNLTMAAKVRTGIDGEVFGIDPSPEMIQEAERKAAEDQLDISYRVGLIEDIPYPDGKFDVVVSSLMLHHLPKDLKRQGIAEISRVLKPGGRFVAVDIDPPLVGNLRIVEEAMRTNGFAGIRRGRTTFRVMFLLIHYVGGSAGRE